MRQIQNHVYKAQLVANTQTLHGQNVEQIHEQVDAFIESFFKDNPGANAERVRQEIIRNMGQILKDAQLDISCYQALGEKKAEYGKYLIFSSLSVPILKNAPLCFQLFHFAPGQTTPIHNHPNPAEDKDQAVLVECASYVVDGMINERLYDRTNHKAEKISEEYRDAGNLRVIDNPGSNPPHSLKNPGNKPATTVHAYTMDGISEGQTIAVQYKFTGFKNPNSAMYTAYKALIKKVGASGAHIAAKDLQAALRENRFGSNPVIVDIREFKEAHKDGALHIEGVSILHVPRGIAIAKILKDFPGRSTHLVLSCCDGARSVLLADELQALGYQSTLVSDGFMGCAQQGLTKAYDAHSPATDTWNTGLDAVPPALTAHIRQLKSNISAITAEELATELGKEKLVVFDVRQKNERSSGVIPNAQRVPAGEFEKKARFHAHDFSTPIAIYSGDDGDYRALVAAKNLREMGYTNVKYLEGGYESYTDQGLPVIDEGSRF